MTIYQGTITEDTVLQAGPLTLRCVFQWPEEIQEQYDDYIRVINDAMRSDPLVTQTGKITSYDYIQFYLDLDGIDLESWIQQTDRMPQSLLANSSAMKVIHLQERITRAKTLNKILADLREVLCYQVTVNNDTVLKLRIGGWTAGPDRNWFIRFVSPRGSIGYGDLQYAIMQVGVP